MRRDVSHQQATENANEALRLLVRLLARAAAREALMPSPQTNTGADVSRPKVGGDRAE